MTKVKGLLLDNSEQIDTLIDYHMVAVTVGELMGAYANHLRVEFEAMPEDEVEAMYNSLIGQHELAMGVH